MKAISVWQPHATLIMLGAKPFETRRWPVPRHIAGTRIAIHASKAPGDVLELAAYVRDRDQGSPAVARWDAMLRALLDGGFERFRDLPLGCILGTVEIGPAVPASQVTGKEALFGNFSPDYYAWPINGAISLAIPVPAMGSRGFFEVQDALFEAGDILP